MSKDKSVWKRIQAKAGGWDLPVLILWAVTLFCIGPFVLLQVFSPNSRYGAIPVTIHSLSEADYSRDPRNRVVPAISLDILRDLMIGGEDLEQITFLQTLTATYHPPTPTPTPLPTGPLGPSFSPTPTVSHLIPGEGTATILPTATAFVEATAPFRRTDTSPTDPAAPTTDSPRPSATTPAPGPTTQVPDPTTPVTPEPSETTPAPTHIIPPTKVTPPSPSQEPTNTEAPPPTNTEAPRPTNTPAPRPTNTPAPRPTNTPDIPITPITFPTKIPTIPGP